VRGDWPARADEYACAEADRADKTRAIFDADADAGAIFDADADSGAIANAIFDADADSALVSDVPGRCS